MKLINVYNSVPTAIIVIWEISTTHKKSPLCNLAIYALNSPLLLPTTHLTSVSVTSLFPQFHTNGFINM